MLTARGWSRKTMARDLFYLCSDVSVLLIDLLSGQILHTDGSAFRVEEINLSLLAD